MSAKREIRRLNSVRGIAVVIVVLSHYSNESGVWDGLLGQGAGQLGVMLFFLLSAFLMSHLYFDISPTKESLKKFAVARIARVIPLFLFVVFFSYGIYQLAPLWLRDYFYNIPDLLSLISHIFLLSGTSVLWSIPPEIHFYAIFACLWLSKRWLGSIVIFIPILFIVISVCIPPQKALETTLFGFDLKLSILQVYPYFCAGFLFGWIYNRWQVPKKIQHHAYTIVLLVIPLLYPNILESLTGFTHALWSDARLLFVFALIFFVIVFFVPEQNRLLENRFGDFLGKVSYSVYLLHYPVLLYLKHLGFAHGLSGMVFFLGVTLLISLLSYRYLEVPARLWVKSRCS